MVKPAVRVADVAVIIPAHNRAETIVRALDSVQAQSMPVRKVIVVDDASTDDTCDVVEAYARRPDLVAEVVLLRMAASGGACVARNFGARHADCAWLAFLDSDDAFRPEKIERQMALVASDPQVVAAFTRIRYMYPGGRFRLSRLVELSDPYLLLGSNELAGCSTAMVRRDTFWDAGGFDPEMPSCQDWDLWLRLSRTGKLAYVADVLVDYFFDAPNQISKNPAKMLDGHRRMYQKIAVSMKSGLDEGEIEARRLLRFSEIYSSHIPDAGMAMRHLFERARYVPAVDTAKQVCRIGFRLLRGRLASVGS